VVAIRGRDGGIKLLTPQEAKASWWRFGAGTRESSYRPRKGPDKRCRDSGPEKNRKLWTPKSNAESLIL